MKSTASHVSFRALLSALGFLVLSFWARGAPASTNPSPDQTKAVITKSLNDFLTYNSDPAQHDRFWAADLIYTSAAGLVKSKPEIMRGMAESAKATTPKSTAPAATYSAEDILVRPYGETAALTFRLVAKYPDGSRVTYRNSGTLLYRESKWQVVTWQATKEPVPAK